MRFKTGANCRHSANTYSIHIQKQGANCQKQELIVGIQQIHIQYIFKNRELIVKNRS